MAIKSIDNIATSFLVLATACDLGLLVYYFTLSSKNIDALWNLPFIVTWLVEPFAFFSLIVFLFFVKPRSYSMVLASAIAFVVPVSLEFLTRNYIFIR